MKQFLGWGWIFIAVLALTSCTVHHRVPHLRGGDLTQESWMRYVDTDPNKWLKGADQWFLSSGEPNSTEIHNRHAPRAALMATNQIRIGNFNKIKVNGDFQVQIFGTDGPTSLYIFGPNASARNINVRLENGTLCLDQLGPAPAMREVIIRIGVRQLESLIQLGCGSIEGIRLRSKHLLVLSANRGEVYLSGALDLHRVVNMGSGDVTLLGATSPTVDIRSLGAGNINIFGNVGVHSIVHHGVGDVNIIGANSNSLSIFTDGVGKIGIVGPVNLQSVQACGRTCVYICAVTSHQRLNVRVQDNAQVGLAGFARDLYVSADNVGKFWGSRLCAINAFVHANHASHVNVAASQKLFATAKDSASVYFFGNPAVASQFISGQAIFIPLTPDGYGMCMMPPRPMRVKGAG